MKLVVLDLRPTFLVIDLIFHVYSHVLIIKPSLAAEMPNISPRNILKTSVIYFRTAKIRLEFENDRYSVKTTLYC